jgi:hypothetical protein
MDSFLKNRSFAITNHNKPRLEVKIFRAENIPSEPGIKLSTKFQSEALKLFLMAPGIVVCLPETNKFQAILIFRRVFFAVSCRHTNFSIT